MDTVEFLPPHQFPPLDPPQFVSSEREGKIFAAETGFSLSSGYPYDVIEDIPTDGSGPVPGTQKARGGAVHFHTSGPAGETYPAIDRGFFYAVNDSEITTKSFWDLASTDYLQSRVAKGDVGLWGYNNSGSRNFALLANDQDHAASMRVYTQGSDKYAALTVDNEKTELYGYVSNGTRNFLLKSDGNGSSLTLQKGSAGCFASEEKVLVYDDQGAFAALYANGGLQLHDKNGYDLQLHPYALRLEDSDHYVGTYEAKQLTLSAPSGDETYISTAAVHLSTQKGTGVYEPHQATLRDQTGGVDLNTTELKAYKSTGAYGALGGAGTLSLRNAQRVQLDLEPTKIEFRDTNSNYAKLAADQCYVQGSDGATKLFQTGVRVIHGTDVGTYEAHQATLRGQNGGVDLNTTELKAYQNSGSYGALGGAGTLSLRNSQGKQLDLEPTKIEFNDNGNYAKLAADECFVQGSQGSSKLFETGVRVIEGSDVGTYEAKQITLGSSSGRETFIDTQYIAIKESGKDRVKLSDASGSGSLTCKSTSSGEGYYATLAMHIKGSRNEQFRADTQGWTVQDSAGTKYTSASSTQLYADDGSGHASMDANGFEVSDGGSSGAYISMSATQIYAEASGYGHASMDAKGFEVSDTGSKYTAIDNEGLSVTDGSKSASVGPNYIEAKENNNTGYLSATVLQVADGKGSAGIYGNGYIQLNDGSGTATISQNSLYLTDGANNINMDVSGLKGKDASWQQLSVCVDGKQKTMYVLGTAPDQP